MESAGPTMHQRQSTARLRNSRPIQPNSTRPAANLPPVLFSLPDLSDPRESQPITVPKPLSTYSDSIAASSPVTMGLNKPSVLQSSHDPKSNPKSSSLLNTAIGFLAFASLLIGLKIYTDTVSERTRTNQRTSSVYKTSNDGSVLANSSLESDTRSVPTNSSNQANTQDPQSIDLTNSPLSPVSNGPQRANFQTPITPVNPTTSLVPDAIAPQTLEPHGHNPVDSASKPVLSIDDTVVQASYPAESQPTQSSPESSSRHDNPNAIAIQADSLNTRDMILLRQGKSIDSVYRDRDEKQSKLPTRTTTLESQQVNPKGYTGVKLTGETYPPVRQKYEPIGIPASIPSASIPSVSRPTSMEIAQPPKPYQPIGASLD